METAIAKVKSANAADIEAWLKTNPPAGKTELFTGDPGMGNLGTAYGVETPGGQIIKTQRPLPKVNLVLISDGKGGYLIHTAYPGE